LSCQNRRRDQRCNRRMLQPKARSLHSQLFAFILASSDHQRGGSVNEYDRRYGDGCNKTIFTRTLVLAGNTSTARHRDVFIIRNIYQLLCRRFSRPRVYWFALARNQIATCAGVRPPVRHGCGIQPVSIISVFSLKLSKFSALGQSLSTKVVIDSKKCNSFDAVVHSSFNVYDNEEILFAIKRTSTITETREWSENTSKAV